MRSRESDVKTLGKGVCLMAKKTFSRRTVEEKKEQVDALLAQLEEGVQQFEYTPEKLKALLEMQSLMYSYSFRNIMLIFEQMPNATYIASFKRWKELNRAVKKGEKSLRVLAPRFKKVQDEVTGQEESKLIGFMSVPVFDCSQTEGEPLPFDRIRLKLDGESVEAEKIFDWVQQLAEADDCKFRIGNGNGANGYYSPVYHEIVVDKGLTINHRAKTAVHELVHSRVHRNSRDDRRAEECVAEGAAFIVCSYFGLDTSSYSFEYVHTWSGDKGESLMKYGEMIQKVSSKLIADIEQLAAGEEVEVVDVSNQPTAELVSA